MTPPRLRLTHVLAIAVLAAPIPAQAQVEVDPARVAVGLVQQARLLQSRKLAQDSAAAADSASGAGGASATPGIGGQASSPTEVTIAPGEALAGSLGTERVSAPTAVRASQPSPRAPAIAARELPRPGFLARVRLAGAEAARASDAWSIAGLVLLAASLSLLAVALFGGGGRSATRVRAGAGRRSRPAFVSRDAERLEARLRARRVE
ncbi:MAG: hypothetical protein ABL963_10745 [Longimicrobiales bacterium]